MATVHSFVETEDFKNYEAFFISLLNKKNKFEQRKNQNKMAYLIKRFLQSPNTVETGLLIEAETGIGKTFAYLVPILEFCNKNKKKCTCIISTNTISLQEQIYSKDIPILKEYFPSTKIAKIKGRSNYVCLRKLFEKTSQNLFKEESENLYNEILNWIEANGSGDKEDFHTVIPINIWNGIQVDNHCFGRGCEFFSNCIVEKNKHNTSKADVIITNHSLVLADYMEGDVLPSYQILIIDEAHNFFKNAINAATKTLSCERISLLQTKFSNKYCGPHLKATRKKVKTEKVLHELYRQVEYFVNQYLDGRIKELKEIKSLEAIISNIDFLETTAGEATEKASHAIIKQGIEAFNKEVIKLKQDLVKFLNFEQDYVFWKKGKEILFCPTESSFLKNFWNGKKTILTSATMTVAGSFNTITKKLFLPKTYEYRFSSPFNYKENGLIYVPNNTVSPKNTEKYTEYLVSQITEIIKIFQEKIFVLFTSYQAMQEVYEKISRQVDGNRHTLLIQKEGVSKKKIIEDYRNSPSAVLFGTYSFWEGVDEDINCVIITKLPFEVPVEPFTEARYEYLEKQGISPFISESLPICSIKLKQGIGRLIRNQNKKGVIVICDSRMHEQSWGKVILKTIPSMPHTRNIQNVKYFVDRIRKEDGF